MFRHRFWNETKTFWYRSRICLENRLFRFGPVPALLDQTEKIFFDGTNLGPDSNGLVSVRLDIGTFVERLWIFCSVTVLTESHKWYHPLSVVKNQKKKQYLLSLS
jgi:hypothetical protein